MNKKRRSILSFLLCGIITSWMLLGPVMVAKGQDRFSRSYINGTVVGMGGRLGGRSLPFRLIINRHTSADELQQLNTALQSGGQDNLLKVLSRMNAGQIQIGNGVGVPANAIIVTPQEMGDVKITVLYQRNVQFFELRYGTRSGDYRFGYAEIFLRGRGSSQGTFIPAAKVRLRDGNTWEVEDFGEFPARLMGLRASSAGRSR
jgi:hypothetical protein